ncbi:MAG: TonB-dependent receptor [Thermoanaerobaculia bacterium]|nr:TonB-dependent receptor [Thermoanaerobaculia bacterium]
MRNLRRNSALFLTLGLAALLLVPAVSAQTTRGSIIGSATDDTGAALPGVTVTISSPDLQGDKVSVTDGSGNYSFRVIPVGIYRVEFALESFQTIIKENIAVNISSTAEVNAEMTTSFTEAIIVTAERPTVNTNSTELGVALDSSFFQALPTGRDYTSVASVTPGAQSDGAGQTFYGSTGAENAYYIDGINTTGVELGQQGKTLNFEFIKEVQVKTAGYNAEYGRSTGGILNVITKSGGNEFHGDVFGYYDSDSLQNDLKGEAENGAVSGSTQTVGFVRSDFGLDLGGYLVKDRLWFFAAYDRVDNSNDLESLEDFGALGIPGAPFRGDSFSDDTTRDLYAGKLTWLAHPSHTVSASVFGDPSTREGALGSLAAPATHYNQTLETGALDYALNYDGIFTSSLIGNLRISQHNEEQTTGGPGRNLVAFVDSTDPLGDGTVPLGWAGAPASSGIGFFQDQEFTRDQLRGDLTYFLEDFAGQHEIKGGYEYEEIGVVNANYNSGGERIYRFACSASRCPNGGDYYYRHRYYVNTKIDPYSATASDVNNPLTVDTKADNYAYFLQDTWRPASNFTVNLGYRMEVQKLYNAFGEVSANIDDNAAPRIGVVWDPLNNGQSKVFAHWGYFYETIPMDIVIRSFGGEISVFAYNQDQNPGAFAGDPGTNRLSTTLGGGVSRVDPATSGQYIEEIIVGGEMEIADNMAIGVKYISRELNSVIEDALSADGDYFIGNPGKNELSGTYDLGYAFGYNETFHELDEPVRTYDGIEVTVRKSLSNNFQFLASALWSELKGSYDGTFQASTGQLDPNLNSAFDYYDFSVNNTGLLSGDREWQVKFDGSYQFDFGLTTGISTYYRTGTPVTAMGYSDAYANWEYYLSERGAFGRVDDAYEMDLHLDYPINLGGNKQLKILVDVFNLLNRQGELTRSNRYTPAHEDYQPLNWFTNTVSTIQPGDPATPPTNTAFNTATSWQNPRFVRVGLRFSF